MTRNHYKTTTVNEGVMKTEVLNYDLVRMIGLEPTLPRGNWNLKPPARPAPGRGMQPGAALVKLGITQNRATSPPGKYNCKYNWLNGRLAHHTELAQALPRTMRPEVP